MNKYACILALVLFSRRGICCPDGADCVRKEDLKKFVEIAKETKCLRETPPRLRTTPITLVTDKEGRLFINSSGMYPYTIDMDWCVYQLKMTSELRVTAGQVVEPDFGFSFRLKVATGYLFSEGIRNKDFYSGLDVGLLFEPLNYKWVNFNLYGGLRGSGIGLGADLTKNLAIHLGGALSYELKISPYAGLGFSLW